MKSLCLVLGLVCSLTLNLAFAATTQDGYTAEERKCVNEYSEHMQLEGADKCEVQEELIECLFDIKGVENRNQETLDRINAVLDKLGKEDCGMTVEMVAEQMEVGNRIVHADREEQDTDPNYRLTSYLDCADSFLRNQQNSESSKCEAYKLYIECLIELEETWGTIKKLRAKQIERAVNHAYFQGMTCEVNVAETISDVITREEDQEEPEEVDVDKVPRNFCVPSIKYAKEICQSLPDGDYPMCAPDCEDGTYLTCSQKRSVPSQCSNANYGSRSYPMVFDPEEKACQHKSPACPRPTFDRLAP